MITTKGEINMTKYKRKILKQLRAKLQVEEIHRKDTIRWSW